MRLAAETVSPLLTAVRRHFGTGAEVWLFGSRADDSARGGDIDLYIETDLDEALVARRIALKIELERLLGEQKIDLVVRPRSRPLAPIHCIARRDGVALGAGEGIPPDGPAAG